MKRSSLLLALACVLLEPAAALAQHAVFPLTSSYGRAEVHGGVRLLTATGQSSAVGRSGDEGALMHVGGWVSRDPSLADPDPFRLTDVGVTAVTPDSAVVTFTVSHDARTTVKYGPTEDYQWEQVVDGQTAVRLTQLQAGELYHWRLTAVDDQGRRRSTRDLTLCTPDLSEITLGLLEARYYRGRNFDELVATRVEAGVDQPARSDNDLDGDFGTGAGPDNFSARYTGLIRLDVEGLHYWRTRQDDGSRTYVDGILTVDAWQEARTSFFQGAASQLDAGWHALSIEYFNGVGPASVRADVRLPGGRLTRLPTDRLAYVNDDFFSPAIQPRDVPVEFECAGPDGVRALVFPPEVIDCQDPTARATADQPEMLPLGATRLVWTAVNRLGYQDLYAEYVEVVDTRPPFIESPATVTVEARSPQGTVVSMPDPSALDVCDGTLAYTFEVCTDVRGDACQACWTEADEEGDPARMAGARNPACDCVRSPSRFPVGVTAVTAVATDDGGNCAGAVFDVDVRDTTPPIIETVDIGPVCDAAPIPRPSVRDNATRSQDIVLTCAIDGGAEGSCDGLIDLPFGGHSITYVATDEAGHRARATLEFTVGDEDPTPPAVALLDATGGFITGEGLVSFRVRDNCDPAPNHSFNPDPDAESNETDVFTARYDREGVFDVTLTVDDFAGNVTVVTAPAFGIDRTAPEARFTGLDAAADADDSLTWPVYFPQDTVDFKAGAQDRAGAANSGVGRVLAVLTHVDSGDARVLLDHHPAAQGVPAAGPARLKNLTCDEVVPPGGTAFCDGAGALPMASLSSGEYELVIGVTDVAGNVGETRRHFVVMNWTIALERTLEVVTRILEGPDVPDLSRLFLDYVLDIGPGALAAVDNPDLLGNALLSTSAIINSLEFAESQGVDTSGAQGWLNQGALDAVQVREDEVSDAVAADDVDLLAGAEHVVTAGEEHAAGTHQASLLSLMNGFFRLEHASAPFIVETKDEANQAAARLSRAFSDYRLIPDAGGQDIMRTVEVEQLRIIADNLFNNALDNPNQAVANVAFLELLVRLNELSGMLKTAQDDDLVWVRNWQWPLALQVRTMAGAALQLTAAALGVDLEDSDDDLLTYTKGVYDEGVVLIADRLVDDALVLYVDARCLIFEVYNHGNFLPQGVPPVAWQCPECVNTGDCEH